MTRHDQWKFLDKLRRKLYLQHELRKTLLRSATRASQLPLAARYNASLYLSLMPKSASRNKIRNRCVRTGRV